MSRFLLRTLYVFLITFGLGLVLLAGWVFLGPDLAYAVERIGNGLTPLDLVPAATATALAEHVPFPRGRGASGTRLVVPRMKLDAEIKEARWTTSSQSGSLYTDWDIPFDAAGHLTTTAQPGEAGKVVISGHNNLVAPNKFGVGLFAGLWDVKPGDAIYVFDAKGRVFEYRATRSYALKEEGEPESVRQQHAQQVLADDGSPTLVLLTCWNGPLAPLSGNTYRWVVDADLVGRVSPDQGPAVG